jgi:hypothetical protein
MDPPRRLNRRPTRPAVDRLAALVGWKFRLASLGPSGGAIAGQHPLQDIITSHEMMPKRSRCMKTGHD